MLPELAVAMPVEEDAASLVRAAVSMAYAGELHMGCLVQLYGLPAAYGVSRAAVWATCSSIDCLCHVVSFGQHAFHSCAKALRLVSCLSSCCTAANGIWLHEGSFFEPLLLLLEPAFVI